MGYIIYFRRASPLGRPQSVHVYVENADTFDEAITDKDCLDLLTQKYPWRVDVGMKEKFCGSCEDEHLLADFSPGGKKNSHLLHESWIDWDYAL